MALDLGKLLKAVRQSDLIITPAYNRYLLSNPECFPLRKDIAKKVLELMTTPPRDRSRSFSCSAAGQCVRKQTFDYLGVSDGKDVVIESQLARIFGNGTYNHLRTQAALWQAGIIYEIERTLRWPRMRSRGSVDGVGAVALNHPKTHWRGKDFGLEFKTANSNVFRKLKEDGPDKYAPQVNRYFLLSGWELFVILVENKDNQELLEWVLEPDPSALSEQEEELRILNEAVDTKTLPPLLLECQKMTGETFRQCPYGGKTGACVRSGAWPVP